MENIRLTSTNYNTIKVAKKSQKQNIVFTGFKDTYWLTNKLYVEYLIFDLVFTSCFPLEIRKVGDLGIQIRNRNISAGNEAHTQVKTLNIIDLLF